MSVFLTGKRIELRSIRKCDLEELSKFMRDREIRELTGEIHPFRHYHGELGDGSPVFCHLAGVY